MKARCPLCGHKTLDHGDGWDGDTLRINGHAIHMTPNESDLLRVLAMAGGRWVSKDSIITGLWGQREPETAEESVRVYVHRLRAKLAPAGIAIESSSKGGRGERASYRIEATIEKRS